MSVPKYPETPRGEVNPLAQMQAKQPYPFWLGGVAASIAGACTHPLDLTKVRLQTSGDKNMFSSIKNTVSQRGLRGLYDGLTGTLLRQMSYSTMRFAVYDKAKGWVHDGVGPAPAWKMALAGSIAGGIAGTLGNPAELVMVRMQADGGRAPELRFNYRNSVQGLYRMSKEEGIGSWTRGLGPNAVRAVLMNMSQLGSYDWFKSELIRHKFMDDGMGCHVVASIGAGTVATTVCSPADVIKSRVMNAPSNMGVMEIFRNSLAKEGPGFMFKGWLPSWTRLQPTTVLIFVTLEQLKNGVDRYRASGGKLL